MRRFVSCTIVAVAAIALGAGGAGAVADQARPPAGSELERLAQPPTYSPFASERIYFVLPGPLRERRPGKRSRRPDRPPFGHGLRPRRSGWYHGGDLAGLTGGCTDTKHGLARLVQTRLHGDLGRPGRRAAARSGGQRRVPRVLGPRLHARRSALRDERGLRCFRGLRAPARAQGLSRRRREPHGRCDPARRRVDVSRRRRGPVPRLQGEAVLRAAPRRDEALPCVSARFQPRQPLVLPQNRALKRPAWLNQVTRYHNRGNIDFSSCSPACLEQGDFFGLDDLFTEQPFVVSGLAAIYGDWVRRYKVDGFRVDTAKHVDHAFFRSWVPRSARQPAQPGSRTSRSSARSS